VLLALALALAAPAALALAAAFPATLRIPRREPGRASSVPTALFSHRTHGAFGCYGCHPSIFPQEPVGFTHDEMRAGRYCGRCHNGQGAVAIETMVCRSCHVPGRW
jgi:c(7)-type cytochrome triheme protein